MAAQYPGATGTDANLYVAVNNLATTLNGAINSAVTTITVVSTTGFPTAGLITIDVEAISYTGTTGTTFTGCTRGADGTTAASHLTTTAVNHDVVAAHHNVLKDEIIAIEADLRAGLPIARGGTNSTTALSNNRIMQSASGKIQEATAITASKALVSDVNGISVASAVTTTELGYVSGVTSAIQTQLGTKVANPLTADLAAGSHKLTGLAAGTTAGDSVRYEQLSPGKILQSFVVQISGVAGTQVSTTSSTLTAATGLSQAITMASSSNKIRIFIAGDVKVNNVSCVVTINKDGSYIAPGTNQGFIAANAAVAATTFYIPIAYEYIDSPGNTSAHTYQVYFRNGDGVTTVKLGDLSTFTMIVQEIGQ